MEDSKNALFVEPNAYIQNFKQNKDKKISKIVFQEPYDCLPNFYLNNNFKKGDCNCVNKPKECSKPCESKKENCNQNSFPLDAKSLLPLLNIFNKNAGGLSGVLNMFSNGNSNAFSGLTSLLGNGNILSNLTNLFSLNKVDKKENEIICTDYEIKKYTKV